MQIIQLTENGVENPVHPDLHFIEANTEPMTLADMREQHIIPVFVKDNSPTISQADFIQNTLEIVEEASGRPVTQPSIRVSHPIKGRIFEARNKPAAQLEDWEKTIYYERMAFVAEIPSIKETVNGQELTLCFGGVKAYNEDNLYNIGGSIQRFRFFLGFKVKVCTNLCIWTDGYSGELKVRNLQELTDGIYEVVSNYRSDRQLDLLEQIAHYELTEQQFAKLVGRARLYRHLPKQMRNGIPELVISDSQMSAITRSYYHDEHFRRNNDGGINLWNLYNLLTHAVKSSYIDSFLDRNVNAMQLIEGVRDALDGSGDYEWFLS